MDFDVELGESKCRITGFYGWPALQDRHLSWQQLRLLATQSNDPWLCVGDYNEVLYSTEMKGGSRAQWQMNNFRDAADTCGLRDIPFEGYMFTFDNGQAGVNNRQCRLDRAVGTSEWFDLFSYAKLFHLDREWSDHAPLKVVFDKRTKEEVSQRKRFRFEHVWVEEEGCEETIRRAWERDAGNIIETISECASELIKWKGINIGGITRDLEKKRKRLKILNEGPSSNRVVKERRLIASDIAKLLRQEEKFCDSALGRFGYAKGIETQNFSIVRPASGGRRIGFKGLFSTTYPENFDDILQGVEGRVSDAMNNILRAEYTGEEVVTALSQMNPLKAPRPDGMNGLFFQTYWHIVGPSVIRQVLNILNGASFPPSLNKAQIVLIPKKKAPDKMMDFRPISLCNVVYKIVSKVLANRLKQLLGDIVSENQSAFTPGRLITNNILLAFEMFHYMKNSRGGGGHMALKLDMSKAYDRVEWNILEAVLLKMGFDEDWVGRVMECVTTVSYEVLVNGTVE
ncbi:uncharacterized protein LOC141634757 [Silene latifolia]|uniref:uncharacterized protein LOC141634757 n=1 Tax=Silene latifolia TaxID=37657 RepID=UPI003D771762